MAPGAADRGATHARQRGIGRSLRTLRGRFGARLLRVFGSPLARAALSLVFLCAALWLIWRELAGISLQDVFDAVRRTAPAALAASLVLTVASYAFLGATEWVSLRALGVSLRFREALGVAARAYAITNNAGFSPLTGTAARLRMYGRKGMSARRAAAVAVVAGLAVTLSGIVTAGLVGVLDPQGFGAAVRLPTWAAFAIAAGLVTPAALWFRAFSSQSSTSRRSRAHVLGSRMRALGLAAGIGDWLASCAALYVLMPHPQLQDFPLFVVAYVASSLVSAGSGVPGGLGVFEAGVLVLTRAESQAHETAAALLLYRCVYSLIPLAAVLIVAAARRLGRTSAPGPVGAGFGPPSASRSGFARPSTPTPPTAAPAARRG